MSLDTIIVAMDFGAPAIETAKWVSRSLAPEAKLILVHAIEPPAQPAFLAVESLPRETLETDARVEAEGRLREIARMLHDSATDTLVRIGRADEVIIHAAIDCAADLIVMGPHGKRSRDSFLLGTTADKVIRASSLPVLVGARVPLLERRGVIAAVTDSPARKSVLEWADLASRALAGELTVLHALESAALSHVGSLAAAHAHGDAEAEHGEIVAELRRQVLHWLHECASCGIESSRVTPDIEQGPAAEAILHVASSRHAAVIVVGRHGHPRGLPALLGRTVRHVLHEARCAVLVAT